MPSIGADDVRVDPRAPTWADRAVRLLETYRWGVYLTILAVTALLVSGRWSIPSLPPWAALALKGLAIGIIPSIFLGKKAIVEPYIPDNRLKILVWDVPEKEVEEAIDHGRTVSRLDVNGKRVSKGLWAERDRGRWPAWEPPGSVDAIVTDFGYDAEDHSLSVEGVNPELSNPADLAVRDGRLAEIYSDLLGAEQDLTRLEATMEAKAVEIEKNDVNALLEAVEHGVSFSANALDTMRGERWGERETDADEQESPDDGVEPDERPTLSDVIETAQSAQQEQQQALATDGGTADE